MSKGVFSCSQAESLVEAKRIMRDWQIRRLPVVDSQGSLVGVISLSDIVIAQTKQPIAKLKGQLVGDELEKTVAAVCRHRPGLKARLGTGTHDLDHE
jgi:CBS-domain-containing membrane protein